MNKWSTSLPSIISLCNDVQFHLDPMFTQQLGTATTTTTSTTSSNKNLYSGGGSSLSDLSILFQAQPSFINYGLYADNYTQSSKASTPLYDTSIERETRISREISSHEQFVSDEELLESLVAYADSFNLDTSVYSIQEIKQQSSTITPVSIRQTPTSSTTPISVVQTPLRRRTQSSTTHIASMIENELLTRHKSCDDISMACSVASTSRPVTVIQREESKMKNNSTKFVPSESHPQFLFATKTDEDNKNKNKNKNHDFQRNHEEKPTEDGTTTLDCSKFEWELSSDVMNELKKSSPELFHNYEATTNIGDINLNYLKDLERCSSMAAAINFSHERPTSIPPSPVIIRKKSKDVILKQQVDIQLLRPPTPSPPPPIIIREVRHKPPLPRKPITIHHKLEHNGQIHISKTPSPIIIRERPPLPPKKEFPSKPTILYRHLPTPPPSPPTVIFERLRPNVPTVIQKPAPILVEKWLPYPPEQKRKIIYERASPLPTRNKRHAKEQAKNIIVQYDDVNVIVNKDIKQRQEIKRVRPDQYVQQYGNSLYSNESLNQLLTDFNSTSQANSEHPTSSHQNQYKNYSPIFH